MRTKTVVTDYHHIKVDDHDAPDLDVLIKAIDYLDQHIEQGKPVLIHCNGGRGRTGVLGTGYLKKMEKIPWRRLGNKLNIFTKEFLIK